MAPAPHVWENLESSEHFVVQERFSLPPTPDSEQPPTTGQPEAALSCPSCSDLQSLGRGTCLACQEQTFRIVYLTTGTPLVVAKSEERPDIMRCWAHLERSLQPMLSALQEASIIKANSNHPQPRSPVEKDSWLGSPFLSRSTEAEVPNSQQLIQREIDDFMRMKMAALVKEDFAFQEGMATCVLESTFRSAFPAFDSSQTVLLCTLPLTSCLLRLIVCSGDL